MAESRETFPPAAVLSRAVLVRNISPLATSATLEDFFSFCGTIESHRLRQLKPTSSSSATPVQQAVVVFSDERARENALVMDKSSIVDTVVSITAVPPNFDFDDDPVPRASSTASGTAAGGGGGAGQPFGFFGSGFSAVGDLFAGVGSAVANEMEKAGKVIEEATDSGVLKSAKDQMALASKRTKDFAADIDTKWHVRENVINAAEAGKAQASAVATVVASQTSNLATQVDRSLHITENTEKLAEKARENEAVNSGIRAVSGGFQTLLSQTGLQGTDGRQPSGPATDGSVLPDGPGDLPTTNGIDSNNIQQSPDVNSANLSATQTQ